MSRNQNDDLETKVASLEATIQRQDTDIRQLQAAMHKLIGLEMDSGCPQSTHGGARSAMNGSPLPAFEPFITRYDLMGSGKVTKLGVGDRARAQMMPTQEV